MTDVIGIPKSTINPTYGLAESCVFVTSCLGKEIRVVDDVVSCGMVARVDEFEKGLAIVQDADKGTLAPDGVVGEIYIRGPDLASAYWGKQNWTICSRRS